jgi:hypothetical protein
MADRHGAPPPRAAAKAPEGPRPGDAPAPTPPADSAYTEEEEAEVQKRLEDLGYVE